MQVEIVHDFCKSLMQSQPTLASINAGAEAFTKARLATAKHGGRWEVRDGKVFRQTQLRLAELPDPETSSDESDYSDDDRYDGGWYESDYILRELRERR